MPSKPLCVIQGPFATRSGYGDMTRDIVRHFIDLDLYELVLISMPWGGCPLTALEPGRDDEIIKRIMKPPVQLSRQPDLFIQVSVPNEFQAHGKYNIGITAGIETTLCSPDWIAGCNRMNVIWTISEHSKRVFESTEAHKTDPAGNVIEKIKVTVPIEILHNCVHTDVFHKVDLVEIPKTVKEFMDTVEEDFNFLFVGHWLQGDLGEDRKNVSLLIKTFLETFKNTPKSKKPGLILKTSGAGFSLIDWDTMVGKINWVREMVQGNELPSIYLLHGELTEEEMNGLYNHPKVKAHVSFTKGEGFGRPLLEACMSQKPILASGWSGHLDFLNPEEAVLINGELKNVHPSAVWANVILAESQWFSVDVNTASNGLMYVFKKYDKLVPKAKSLAKKNKEKFNYEAVKRNMAALIDKSVPKFAVPAQLKLPELKRVKLPELKPQTPNVTT